MPLRSSFVRWASVQTLAMLLAALVLFPSSPQASDLQNRLALGEIISSSEHVDGTSCKQGQVTGVVDAPPARVWRVITDVNHFHEFMPRTIKSQVVTPEQTQMILQKKLTHAHEVEALLGPTPPDPASFRVPGGKYVESLYSHLDLPWPLHNRWCIIKMQRDETRATQHIYTSSWSLEIGNLRENRGEWRLEPFGDNKTRLTYRLVTDPGGSIPKFLVNQGTYVTLPQIIKAVRKRAAQLAAP